MFQALTRVVTGITAGNGGRITNMVDRGDMTTVRNLPETSQIQKFTQLPGLPQCTDREALKVAAELETMKAQLSMMKKIAASQKGKMDTAKAAIETRLDVRKHGMSTAAEVAKLGANHRVAALELGYTLQEQANKVDAWSAVNSQSSALVDW